jgi:universal stress protein E
MIDKILLLPAFEGIDQAAMRRTAALATAAGAAVHVFKPVYEPHLEGYLGNKAVYASLRQRFVDETREQQEALAQSLRDQGIDSTAGATWGHPAHEAVAAEVLSSGANIVVTAPSEPSGALSHDDWKLVASCPVPLLLVMSDGSQRYKHIVAALDPYHEHGKPAELDISILEHADELRSLTQGELRVLHCFTPLSEFVARGLEQLPVKDAENALEKARRDALMQIVKQVGLEEKAAELTAGRPARVLLAMAERGEADLFVLGSVSRSIWREFFIGSTTERVLRQTKTDTLIVKPPGSRVTVSVQTR